QYGDPSISDFAVDGNVINGGYTFNVAQPVAIYGAQSGLFSTNFLNHADNSNLSSTATGTCSGATLTTTGVSGYWAKDDVISGTGITAGTYIVAQLTGPAGGVGGTATWTMSVVCTATSAALTARPGANNYTAYGSTLNVIGGWVQNSQVLGKLFIGRPITSATYGSPYAKIKVNGSTIEGADQIFTTNT
ncbi:hypothetical protein K7462_29470, partial [Pseudomonas fluorescens]|uniref:hypothetical protein n=1 Tax=Pseudomonas fluorescens TaxID=294 RepID=UPI001CA61D73